MLLYFTATASVVFDRSMLLHTITSLFCLAPPVSEVQDVEKVGGARQNEEVIVCCRVEGKRFGQVYTKVIR